jgi:excisionase family DNA binding protein
MYYGNLASFMVCYVYIVVVRSKNMLRRGYYTAEEVADYYRVSADTIRKLCRDGKIPGAKQIGRQWRIPAKFLEDNPSLDTSGEDESEEQRY